MLLHARRNFKEAEELYYKALDIVGGFNETVEMALAALKLAKGEAVLKDLKALLAASHIQTKPNTETEGWIIHSIHCPKEELLFSLTKVKERLVTQSIRPKLILMFDANLMWAKENNIPYSVLP